MHAIERKRDRDLEQARLEAEERRRRLDERLARQEKERQRQMEEKKNKAGTFFAKMEENYAGRQNDVLNAIARRFSATNLLSQRRYRVFFSTLFSLGYLEFKITSNTYLLAT